MSIRSMLKIVPKLTSSIVFKNNPFKISFSITNVCNCRCKNCNIWCIYQEQPKKLLEELTLDEYKKIFSKLPRSTAIIEFTGGEPFLKKDFSDIVIASINLLKPYKIYIPTNGLGTINIEDTIQKIIASKEWEKSDSEINIGVSIDGFEKMHDYLRGVQKTYSRAWETFKMLQKLSEDEPRLKCFISVTLFEYNVKNDEVFEFINMLRDNDIQHGLQCFNNSDYYHNSTSNSDTRIVAKINENVLPLYSKKLLPKYRWNKTIEFLKNPKKTVLPCYALDAFLAFDPYGNIWPCLMWPKKIANIKDYDYDIGRFFDINKDIKNFKELIKKGKCQNCWTACTSGQRILFTSLTKPWKL